MRNVLKFCVYRGLLVIRDVLTPLMRFSEVSILCYHSVSDAPHDTAVSKKNFEAQLQMFRDKGYVFASLADIERWMKGESHMPRRAVVLTFDDGYSDFETIVLPLLERFNAPATVFVVGDGAASRVGLGNTIPLLDNAGVQRVGTHRLVTVGYHSRTHADLTKLSDRDLQEEVTSPFRAAYIAYPGGKHDERVHEAARAAGYRAALSIRPGLVHRADNMFALTRNVITQDMSLEYVRLRATMAIQWYRSIIQAL